MAQQISAEPRTSDGQTRRKHLERFFAEEYEPKAREGDWKTNYKQQRQHNQVIRREASDAVRPQDRWQEVNLRCHDNHQDAYQQDNAHPNLHPAGGCGLKQNNHRKGLCSAWDARHVCDKARGV
ncbi:MAG: hypothetical protein LAN64_05255 [Acidobacteriia bacterium]|nr:hypothetical protein [Terriglobia bacterium]